MHNLGVLHNLNMKLNNMVTLILVNCIVNLNLCECGKNLQLSRKKRHLTFPEGASLSVSFKYHLLYDYHKIFTYSYSERYNIVKVRNNEKW